MKKSVKLFLKCFILSFFITFNILNLCFPQPPVKKIKLFLEVYATSPVVWESVELIKSPPDELKIFFFHRYPRREKHLDLKAMNAIEIPLTPDEGFWTASISAFIKEVKKILKQYPENIPIEVYSNLNQTRFFLLPLLFEIDSKRIERIHLYEDGSCNMLAADYTALQKLNPSPDIIKNIIETKGKPTIGDNIDLKAAVSKLAPATYHLCRADTIKNDPKLKNFVQYIGEKNIVTTDLFTEKKRLRARERSKLARFFNIKPQLLEKTSSRQKTIVITTGCFFDNQEFLQSEIENFQPIKSFNARILLKCHPSYSAQAECRAIQKAFPNWENINAYTPLEALFLAGLDPDYVGGYSSSLYFLIPPEKILFLLGAKDISRFLDLKIINESQRKVPDSF